MSVRTRCGSYWMDRKNNGLVKVYGMALSLLEGERAFERGMVRIPEKLRERVEKCRNDVDKRRRLAGFLLLLYGLKQVQSADTENAGQFSLTYCVREGGKPYLADYPEFHFNISHSGQFAVCAVSEREVGIDIQKQCVLHGDIAARFFTKAENTKLHACRTKEEQDVLFFRYWSAKEAYVKLTGEGLAKGLAHIEVDLENGMISDKGGKEKTAYVWEMQMGMQEKVRTDYFLAVCSEKTMRVEMEWIKAL